MSKLGVGLLVALGLATALPLQAREKSLPRPLRSTDFRDISPSRLTVMRPEPRRVSGQDWGRSPLVKVQSPRGVSAPHITGN